MSNYCSHGTPPASIFKVHIWIFATTTKICNMCNFALTFVMRSATNRCTLLHIINSRRINRMVSVARFSAIHFRGKSIRQVSCYTFLSGFQLPWPPSCCQNEPTPFVVSHERTFEHLTPPLGSSLIASSAYQKRPTKCIHWKRRFTEVTASTYPFKVWE